MNISWKQLFCINLLFIGTALGVELPQFAAPEMHLSNINFHTVHPKAAYDNNLGKFSVSYSVPLPVGKRPIRSSLSLSYNSQMNFNIGYGLGFELRLPFLQKLIRHERAAYLYDDGSSVYELGLKNNQLIELELTSFSRYEFKADLIVITSTDGVSRTFNAQGLLVKEVYPGLNNTILFQWTNFRLSKITLPEDSVHFVYEKCSVDQLNIKNGEYPIYFKGALRDQNSCLMSLNLEDRSLNLTYNDYRGLTSANWNNDPDQNIFQASYNISKLGSNRVKSNDVTNEEIGLGDLSNESLMISHGKGRVTFFTEQKFYESQKFLKNKVVNEEGSGEMAQIFPADFNNDGLTDYLVYNSLRSADSENNSGWLGSGVSTGGWGPVKMELRLGKETNDGTLVFEPSFEYQLSSNFQIVRPHDDRKTSLNFVLLFPTTPIFGDFDGNKKTDILLCGERSGIAYNTNKGFVESAHITCPKESIATDINLDGITDLVTKDNVYLGTPQGLLLTNIVPSEIKTIQTKLKSNEIKFGVFDLNMDGLPEALTKDDVFFVSDINQNKTFQFWSPSKGISSYQNKEIFPLYPLMNLVKMQEGGQIRISYDVTASIPVVKSVLYDNLQNLPRVETLSLYQPFFDPYTNEILGFNIVKKLDHATDYFPGKINVAEYFSDNRSEDVWSRSQKHGLINREYLCELDGCEDLIKSLLNGSKIFPNYLQSKEYTYKIIHPFTDERYLIYPSKTTVINYKNHNIENASFSQTDIKTSELLFSDFSEWGPLSKLATEYDSIKNTSQQKQVISRYTFFDGMLRILEEQTIGTNESSRTTLSHVNYSYSGSLIEGNLAIQKKIRTANGTTEGAFKEAQLFNQSALLSSSISAQGNESIIDYDGRNLTDVTSRDADGLTSHKQYDDYGQVSAQSISSAGEEISKASFRYSPTGKLVGLSTDTQDFGVDYKYHSTGATQTIRVSGKTSKTDSITEIRSHDGFGKLLKSEQRQGQQAVVSKDQLVDSFGLTLLNRNRNLRVNGESYSPQDVLSVTFNAKSQVETENDLIHDRTGLNRYQGLSVSKYEDNILLVREKRNGLGLLQEVSTNSKTLSIFQNEQEELLKLGDYHFSRDLRGNIVEVRDDSNRTLFEQRISPTRVTINDTFSVFMDKKGRVGSISLMDESTMEFSYDSFSRLESLSILDGMVTEKVIYDNESAILNEFINVGGKKVVVNNKYDDFKNLKEQSFRFDSAEVGLNYHSNLGMVQSVAPYIQNISYDLQGKPSQIAFKNLTLSIQSDATGLIKSIEMGQMKEEYFHNSRLLMSQKQTNIGKSGKTSVGYNYNDDKQLIEGASKTGGAKRDTFHNLIDPALKYADAKSGILSGINGLAVNYKSLESIFQVGGEQYLSSDLHLIEGNFVKYFRLGSKIIGAFICKEKCEFYPVLTDYQNSVKAIFNEEGLLLVERSFTTWGELESVKLHNEEAKKIDRLIRYDFAGLIRPYKTEFLISNTRVYAPAYGQWHKVDPLIYEKPEVFIQGRILESDALSYAGGDPVNKVDPSGKVALETLVAVSAVTGAFVGVVGEMVSNPNYTTNSLLVAGGVGFASGVSMVLLPMMVPFEAMASGLGSMMLAKGAVGAILGGTSNAITQSMGDSFSYAQLAVASGISGFASMFSANLSGFGASAVGQSYERSIDLAVTLGSSSVDILSSIVFGRDEDRRGNNDIFEKNSFNFAIPEFNGAQLQNQMIQQQREEMNYQRQQSCQ